MNDQSFSSPGPAVRRGTAGTRPRRGDVVDFASWVVTQLATRRSGPGATLRPALLAAFRAAVLDEDPARLDAFVRLLVRQKVSAGALADVYIPAVARMLGDDWLEDRASFLDVTLGSARLQALLRAIGAAWTADAGSPAHAAALLLVVPDGEQHSLGAMVLIGQLRRLGISVRLVQSPSRMDLRRILAESRFCGVFLSLAVTDRLAEVPALVSDIRAAAPAGLPIVLGGHVVQSGSDLSSTGADAVTCDLSEALAICGIQTDGNSALRRA